MSVVFHHSEIESESESGNDKKNRQSMLSQ